MCSIIGPCVANSPSYFFVSKMERGLVIYKGDPPRVLVAKIPGLVSLVPGSTRLGGI